MQTRYSRIVQAVLALGLLLGAAAPRASAQTPARLRLQFSAGHPNLSITGNVGSVCTIQFINGFAPTNNWQFLTNLTLLSSSPYSVVDSNVVTMPRFYRAFSQQPPTNVVTTNIVYISPGTFVMGSPTNEPGRVTNETQHTVMLTKGFWIGKYEVTQGEYQTLMATNPSYCNGDRSGPPYNDKDYGTNLSRPVELVSWIDATNYCALLTAQELNAGRIPANYVYRLPTESEWEYSCRAGTTTAFYVGSSLRSDQANIGSGAPIQRTSPEGSYPPNPWGLYDISGNVFEHCQDWYGVYPIGSVTDPQGPDSGTQRVYRGGGWRNAESASRSAYRGHNSPLSKLDYYGFRIVLAPIQ